MPKVATLIAANIASITEGPNVTAIIASSVIQAVNDAETPGSKELQVSAIDSMPPDKQAYYISLALREVQSIIETANFNLGGPLQQGKPTIQGMYFERDGSAGVDVVVPFTVEALDDYSSVSSAFNLELRKEYKDLVKYTVKMPTVAKPNAAVELDIRIPGALLTSIGADKFDTRTKVLQKYMEGALKKELAG